MFNILILFWGKALGFFVAKSLHLQNGMWAVSMPVSQKVQKPFSNDTRGIAHVSSIKLSYLPQNGGHMHNCLLEMVFALH